MTQPLGVGLIGCGLATTDRHLPAMSRIAEVEAVALADIDASVLSQVADRFGIARRYADAGELIADPGVEAVAVCVPAAQHVEVALAALDAGKHVFVEKPLSLSLEEADRLIERAAPSPLKAQVGFNLRWHRLARQARKLIAGGGLGRIQAVRSVYSDPIVSRPGGLPDWRRKRLSGGGSVLEKGVHHFDLWRFLVGEEVEQIAAWSTAGRGDDETVSVTGRTTGSTLLSGLVCDSTTISNELTIYGESATLQLDLYRSDGFELRNLEDLPGAPAARLRRMVASAGQLAGNVSELRHGGAFDTSYDGEWRHFAAAVREGREPACTLEDGRRALQIALAVLESAAAGKPMDVADAPQSVAALAVAEESSG
jgi:myo-inositol 2-dehydrogenase/D-chiro-inositol 1-dehydrogenase